MNFLCKKQHKSPIVIITRTFVVTHTERRKNKGEEKSQPLLVFFSDGTVEPIQTTAKQRSSSVPLLSVLRKCILSFLEKKVSLLDY
jgi:hypothetical protein